MKVNENTDLGQDDYTKATDFQKEMAVPVVVSGTDLDKKGNPVKEKRNCDYCGKEFTHSLYGNFAVYCPHCKKLAYETDERGFWYVTPFAVSIGEEQVAGVTHEGRQAPYILRSEKYNLNINLKNRYVEALNEALEIVEKYIEK